MESWLHELLMRNLNQGMIGDMPDKNISSQTFLLASQSPRRAAILEALGVTFDIAISDAEEDSHFPPSELMARIPPLALSDEDHPVVRAWRKGNHIAQLHPHAIVLAADTIVVCDSHVLNKPVDRADAMRMLKMLSGRSHQVYTGMVRYAPQHEPVFWVQMSTVTMRELDAIELERYVASGEPMDKAGAYGIQGMAGSLVASVTGSFTNVVGLPMEATIRLLSGTGVCVARTVPEAFDLWRRAHPLLRTELGDQP